MSTAQHTLGPWVVGEADWTNDGDARYSLVGIKTVNAPDARLIAAAPELLAALRPFANYACTPPCDCHNCKARAAIAKATGSAA